MLSKAELLETLSRILEDRGVDDADEVAADVVENLDEMGAFESDDFEGA